MLSKRSVLSVLVLVQLWFGTLPIAAKIVMRELSSDALVLIRVAGAAVLFYVLHRLTTRESIRSGSDYRKLALYSLLGVSLNQWFYLEGLSRTTATAAQMLIVAGPAVTLALGIAMRKELPSRGKWIGIGLAASGALSLVAAVPPAGRIGNLIIITNVVMHSIYLVLARDLARTYRPLTMITWIFIFGALALIPVGGASLVKGIGSTSVEARLAILWIILVPTVAAYYGNMWALTHVESSTVAMFVYLQPVMTAILAIPILHERPSPRLIPSALLIAAGVAVAIREQRTRIAVEDPSEIG